MRVLHIDTGRQMRGGQWQALHLLQGLAERGIASRLLSPPDSALSQAAAALALDVRPLRPAGVAFSAAWFDLIHAHDARAHTLALFSSKRLVVSRRVAFPVQPSLLSRFKSSRPRHYLAVSEFVKQRLLQAGVPEDKITVVHDGVRVPDRVRGEDRPLILALDSSDPAKGRAIVEKAALLASVSVHFSNRLLEDLPKAELFVYITECEGLGSAVLLAMGYDAPVIASRVGGLPEIVRDGDTGLLTDNAPARVAASIRRLLGDRSLALRLATRARTMVEQNFTVAHMVHNTLRVYERILA
jgi:glycosyltransferase involved in cell wall biosynthesis